jgi:hypothetical protein
MNTPSPDSVVTEALTALNPVCQCGKRIAPGNSFVHISGTIYCLNCAPPLPTALSPDREQVDSGTKRIHDLAHRLCKMQYDLGIDAKKDDTLIQAATALVDIARQRDGYYKAEQARTDREPVGKDEVEMVGLNVREFLKQAKNRVRGWREIAMVDESDPLPSMCNFMDRLLSIIRTLHSRNKAMQEALEPTNTQIHAALEAYHYYEDPNDPKGQRQDFDYDRMEATLKAALSTGER